VISSPFVGQKADLIVCNPPYISTAEYLELDRSVRDYEPKLALLAGDSGRDL
jgi:release factor glutamine methyltransferase